MAMTPAMVVVLTAPRPTSSMPSLPPAGAIGRPFVTGENYIIRDQCRMLRAAASVARTRLRLFLAPSASGLSPYQTAVAMVGARAGDRVLVIGSDDADLAAHVALVTGLSGDVRLADQTPGAAARVETAVRRVGALVEFAEAPPAKLPFDAGTFDASCSIVVSARSLSPNASRRQSRLFASCGRAGAWLSSKRDRRKASLRGFRNRGRSCRQRKSRAS